VILDLLADDGIGFLSDDRRLCVVLSRARDGMLVIMPGKIIEKLPTRSSSTATNLVRILKPFRVEHQSGKTLLPSRWYTPATDHNKLGNRG
jgi:hypothetical protein